MIFDSSFSASDDLSILRPRRCSLTNNTRSASGDSFCSSQNRNHETFHFFAFSSDNRERPQSDCCSNSFFLFSFFIFLFLSMIIDNFDIYHRNRVGKLGKRSLEGVGVWLRTASKQPRPWGAVRGRRPRGERGWSRGQKCNHRQSWVTTGP